MVGDLIMRALYGSPIQEAYGGGGGPFPPGGIVGAMTGQSGPAASQGPAIAPAQATQSPPDMAKANSALASNPNIVQLYLRQEQLNRAADQFDRGLEGLVLSKTPPAMQSGVIASMSPQPRDAGTELQNLMSLQQGQMRMQGFAQLMAGIPNLSKISGIDQNTLQGIAMMDPQAYEKIVETYGGIGGGTDQDYMRAMAKARMNHPDMTTQQIMQTQPWLVNTTTFNQTTKQAAEAKANAMESYPQLSEVAKDTKAKIDWLADPTNRQSVAEAIANPTLSSANVAKWSSILPQGLRPGATADGVTTARNNIDWLKARLQTTEFAGTKNVRSTREFENLGSTATNLDKATMANNPEALQTELDRLQTNAWTEDANLAAESGHAVPDSEAGLAGREYFNPEHPLYNGGTEGKLKPMPDDARKEAEEKIAAHPAYRHAIIMQARAQGFDPTGL